MTNAPTIENHPHHQKLAAIQLNTAVTRDMSIISAAFVVGLLSGQQFEAAQNLVRRKLVALLNEVTR